MPPLHMGFENYLKARVFIFGGISRFLKSIIFRYFLADLGKFCYIGNRWKHAQILTKTLKTP